MVEAALNLHNSGVPVTSLPDASEGANEEALAWVASVRRNETIRSLVDKAVMADRNMGRTVGRAARAGYADIVGFSAEKGARADNKEALTLAARGRRL